MSVFYYTGNWWTDSHNYQQNTSGFVAKYDTNGNLLAYIEQVTPDPLGTNGSVNGPVSGLVVGDKLYIANFDQDFSTGDPNQPRFYTGSVVVCDLDLTTAKTIWKNPDGSHCETLAYYENEIWVGQVDDYRTYNRGSIQVLDLNGNPLRYIPAPAPYTTRGVDFLELYDNKLFYQSEGPDLHYCDPSTGDLFYCDTIPTPSTQYQGQVIGNTLYTVVDGVGLAEWDLDTRTFVKLHDFISIYNQGKTYLNAFDPYGLGIAWPYAFLGDLNSASMMRYNLETGEVVIPWTVIPPTQIFTAPGDNPVGNWNGGVFPPATKVLGRWGRIGWG